MKKQLPSIVVIFGLLCAKVVTGGEICSDCDWAQWTSCSRSCGTGTRSRTTTGSNPVGDEEFCFLVSCESLTEMSVFQQLVEDSYHRFAVPRDVTGAVTVTHTLFLNRILQLDIERQILTIDAWQMWAWRDPHLKHLMSTTDLERLEVPVDLIWVPDIILYNSASSPENLHHVKAGVSHDGTVTYIPPAHVDSFCHVDDVMAPGDIVSCTLMFGSWVYNSGTLVLEAAAKGASLTLFTDFSRDWTLLNTDCKEVNMNGYRVLLYTLNLAYQLGQ